MSNALHSEVFHIGIKIYIIVLLLQVGPVYRSEKSQSIYYDSIIISDGVYIWSTLDAHFCLYPYNGVRFLPTAGRLQICLC